MRVLIANGVDDMRLMAMLKRAGLAGIDFLFPPHCLGCGRGTDEVCELCDACYKQITFIDWPYCWRCGLPLPRGCEGYCVDCSENAPLFVKARSVFMYDQASRWLVFRLKQRNLPMARLLAGWMKQIGGDVIEGCDRIVPVPLHWKRFWARHGNQAADLAYELGKSLGCKVWPHLLRRRIATPVLAQLSPQTRQQVLAGSIACLRPIDYDRHILLVDDVMTTGITAQICSEALYSAGALSVKLLTAARAPLPAD